MRNEKITPLYERLSRDDELQGEAAKAAIRAEDMGKGIHIPVSQLPHKEPQRVELPANAAM